MYFKHRTFEKMRQMGNLTYEEFIKAAVLKVIIFVANIAIKHLVASRIQGLHWSFIQFY